MGVEPETQRGQRQTPARRVLIGVGAKLDQLEVVVAEMPEALLDDLQRVRVVEDIEGPGRLLDDRTQPLDERQVEGLGDVLD